jgi:hypothetical protein
MKSPDEKQREEETTPLRLSEFRPLLEDEEYAADLRAI